MITIDMPMPDNCVECRFNVSEFGYCNAMPVNFCGQVNDREEDGKPEWCPLKAQEPVEPRVGHDGWYRCGGCNNPLASGERVKHFYGYPWPKYCEECGRMVKWE